MDTIDNIRYMKNLMTDSPEIDAPKEFPFVRETGGVSNQPAIIAFAEVNSSSFFGRHIGQI